MNRFAYANGIFKRPPRPIKKRSKTNIERAAAFVVGNHPYKLFIDTFIKDGFSNKQIMEDIEAKYRNNKKFHLPLYVIRAYRNQVSK